MVPLWALLALAATIGTGCSELRGRHRVREGNQLYREGKLTEAVRSFQAAEALVRGFWLLWFNEGLACRQMMVPGSQTALNDSASSCALRAFDRLRKLRPSDARGDQLYVQTLFDADRFAELAALYQQRLQARTDDRAAINGLVQTYTRWNRPEEALRWHERRAALDPRDAEAQYAVGVFVWNQLFQKGGGPEMAAFDPRPSAEDATASAPRRHGRGAPPPPPARIPPLPGLGDIVGSARVRLADLGIAYLTKALALRPHYRDAMIYLNLLYRQRSFAFFSDPTAWQSNIDSAERWRHEAEKEGAHPSP